MRIFNDDVQTSQKMAKILLQLDCSIETRNRYNHTPLIQALYNGNNEAVRFAL